MTATTIVAEKPNMITAIPGYHNFNLKLSAPG